MVVALVAAMMVIGVVSALPASAAGGPTLSVGDQSGLERDAVTGSVFVPIYLSAPATEPVVVSYYTVDGTAIAGLDYSRWGTPAHPRTVTIPTGAVQTQVNVPVLSDNETESDESFSLVATASGGDVVVGDDTGTATIVDADAVSTVNPAITVSNTTVIEGDQGERRAQFQVHLSRPPATNVTISYSTADDTAVAGVDYTAKLPGTVVFAPGQISKTIDVLVTPNTTADGPRDFNLNVVVTGGSPVEELNMVGVATIIDDDAAPAACAPGTFNTTDGNEPCTPAPPGTYIDTAGALAATPCDPGSYQNQYAQTSCQLAPIGSYVETSGSTTATACPEGTTTAALGATSPDDCTPVAPPGATQVAAGGSHTCALLGDGTVSCWGANYYGQLGNGTNTRSNVPVPVTGITNAVSITAGTDHSCAVLGDGTVELLGPQRRRPARRRDQHQLAARPAPCSGSRTPSRSTAATTTPARCSATAPCAAGASTTMASSETATHITPRVPSRCRGSPSRRPDHRRQPPQLRAARERHRRLLGPQLRGRARRRERRPAARGGAGVGPCRRDRGHRRLRPLVRAQGRQSVTCWGNGNSGRARRRHRRRIRTCRSR